MTFQDHCALCPRRCGALRHAGERGLCGEGAQMRVARAALHHWEEPCISGTRGSGTIFFSGCALGCVYCQNAAISQEGSGALVSAQGLRGMMEELAAQGAHNVNLVTPSHFLPGILEALAEPLPVPVVWNSGGYELPESVEALRGKVHIFLPDWKYALEEPASLYSRAPDYPEVAMKAIEAMIGIAGEPVFDGEGIMLSGVLVRHLVLPGHLSNTRSVVDAFAERFRGRALFSLMGQYLPVGGAMGHPRIARRLTRREYESAVDYMFAKGIEDGFVQEAGADDVSYVPAFDLTGVLEG